MSPALGAMIERAAALLASDPAGAERAARAALAQAPGDPRAVLILASARRRQGDFAGARALLEPLARAHPRAAHTQYELGVTLAALNQTEAATAALRRAVDANRDLGDAWRALGDLLFGEGEMAGAEAAYAQHARAAVQDPQLKPAAEALFQGRAAEAESIARRRLTSAPHDVRALRLLADALVAQERYADAEAVLAEILTRQPDLDGARFAYAEALFHQQKAAQALPQIRHLMAKDEGRAPYRNLLAACLALIGDLDAAGEVYTALLADYPRQPQLWLNHGHLLRTVRRGEEAALAYRRCIELSPGCGDAYWSLANLKVAPFSPDDIAAMRRQVARADLPGIDRLHLNYALGKALEDAGAYDDSFTHYAAGAALRRQSHPYDAAATTAEMQRARTLFTPDFLAARAGSGAPAADPIFVVGLPRSGSTLIEQILASHSAVEGTMELPDIGLVALEIGGADGAYPEALSRLSPAELRRLGEGYLAATVVHRRLGRPFFIDKMPNNFRHIGLIQLILPNAKIVDARRHPLGACFSAFKQHFAQGQGFSYDQGDLGRYYRDYVELMDHFDAVLPGRVHRVIYEDLVEDTEGQVRRLLDYCGLPFEAGCLEFHKNDRAVRTVSSEQVRRPIFREGLDRWRRYEAHLEPLKAALGPALEGWRAPPPRG